MTQANFLMLLFNIISLNSNAYVTFIKKLFDASQMEFLLRALQVRLRGLLDLAIVFEPCSCSAGCSKGHWIGIVVTPTLLTGLQGPNDFYLLRHPNINRDAYNVELYYVDDNTIYKPKLSYRATSTCHATLTSPAPTIVAYDQMPCTICTVHLNSERRRTLTHLFLSEFIFNTA